MLGTRTNAESKWAGCPPIADARLGRLRWVHVPMMHSTAFTDAVTDVFVSNIDFTGLEFDMALRFGRGWDTTRRVLC